MARRGVDHLHGQMHGDDERRRPDRAIIVPSSQIVVPPLPETYSQGLLLTKEEAAEMLGWKAMRIRSFVALGRFEPRAILLPGRKQLFDRDELTEAAEKWPIGGRPRR